MRTTTLLTIAFAAFFCFAGHRLPAAGGDDLDILELEPNPLPAPKGGERGFLMGFSNIPPSITPEGLASFVKFIETHGDLVSLGLDGGVPWVEALKGKDYSMSLMDEWKGSRSIAPKSHTLLVSITPLDESRAKLAKYWGEKKKLDLPNQWSGKTLDSAEVKKAYLAYARSVVKYFNPKYLSLGDNVNESLTASPSTWRDYKNLHKHVYTELKKEYPKLRVFATFSLAHLTGLYGADKESQKREVVDLLKHCDLVGLSLFPYGPGYAPKNKLESIGDEFLAPAFALGKPIGVVETGAPSRKFKGLGGEYDFGENYQSKYLEFILKTAQKRKFEFVVNKVAMDFDKLLELCPPEARDFLSLLAYTGLAKGDGAPKKVLATWDAFLKQRADPAGR